MGPDGWREGFHRSPRWFQWALSCLPSDGKPAGLKTHHTRNEGCSACIKFSKVRIAGELPMVVTADHRPSLPIRSTRSRVSGTVPPAASVPLYKRACAASSGELAWCGLSTRTTCQGSNLTACMGAVPVPMRLVACCVVRVRVFVPLPMCCGCACPPRAASRRRCVVLTTRKLEVHGCHCKMGFAPRCPDRSAKALVRASSYQRSTTSVTYVTLGPDLRRWRFSRWPGSFFRLVRICSSHPV